MSNNVKEIILRTVTDNNMIVCNDKIIVGVSGGADSMCLLHFLVSVKSELSLEIVAAHINHKLRGNEALRDQQMVQKYCRDNNVECQVLSADVNKISAQTGEGSEECGRRIRYEFFGELAGSSGKIATAHTLSDSAETVIFNMARGTGLKGLIGIPKIRGNIIRPLIDITRKQVEDYCKSNGIKYVTDSTNLTDIYNRNKIRHTVVPALKEINPCAEAAIQRLSEIISQQLSLTNHLACKLLEGAKTKNGYSCKMLTAANPTVLKQAIISILQDAGCGNFEERHISLITDVIFCGGIINLPKGFTASARQGVFRVYSNVNSQRNYTSYSDNKILLPKIDTTFVINKQKIIFRIISKEEYDEIISVHKFLVNNSLDYDIIHGETLFRTRQPGDTFKQCGRGVTKTLKKLFIEAKIPQENRNNVVLLASGNEVVWLQGFGVSEKYKITNSTKTVAVIEADGV